MKTQVIDLSQVTMTMQEMIELQRAGVEVKDPKNVTVTAAQFKVINSIFKLTENAKPAPAAKPVPAAKPAPAAKAVPAAKPAPAAKAVPAAKPAPAAKAVPAAKPAPAAKPIEIFDYSEKCYAVVGDTKPIKEALKANGGRFNMFLTIGEAKEPGWIFSKRGISLETLYEIVK